MPFYNLIETNLYLGVDDVMSECDLDDYSSWDLKVNNNSSDEFHETLNCLEEMVKDFL